MGLAGNISSHATPELFDSCVYCRRKKKCIQFSVDDDDHNMKDEQSEVEDDDVMVTPGLAEAAVMLSEAPGRQNEHSKELPHMYPVTLRTIPT